MKVERFSVLAIALSTFLLSACLDSEKPLLAKEQQERWFDSDSITLIELDKNGVINNNPIENRPEVVKLSFTDKQWQDTDPVYSKAQFYIKPNDSAGKNPLVFASIAGQKNIAIAQEKASGSYRYYLVRRFQSKLTTNLNPLNAAHDGWIGVSKITLLDTELAALKKAGINIEKRGLKHFRIASRDDLALVVETVFSKFLAHGNDPTAYDKRYIFASKPSLQSDMVALGKVVHCLNVAGHRDDEYAAKLKPNNMGGVALGDIPATVAQSACDEALELLPERSEYRNSILFSSARIMIKRKQLAEAEALLAKLDGSRFPLKYAANANLAHLTSTDPEEGARQGFDIVENAINTLELKGRVRNALLLQKANWLLALNDNDKLGAAREILQQLTESEYYPAAVLLAKALKFGWGGPVDLVRSKQIVGGLYEKRIPESYLEMSKWYYYGELGVQQDLAQAYSLLSRAHQAGQFKEAYYMAGFMEMYGHGTEQDVQAGFKHLSQAILRDHNAAEGEVGRAYYLGHGITRNKARGIRHLQKAADAGDANSKKYLSYVNNGRYAEETRKRQNFVHACKSGDTKQCNSAGYMLERGQGGELNPKAATELYTKACDSGFSQGCYNLGLMQLNGAGGDKSNAAMLFAKACEAGIQQACNAQLEHQQ